MTCTIGDNVRDLVGSSQNRICGYLFAHARQRNRRAPLKYAVSRWQPQAGARWSGSATMIHFVSMKPASLHLVPDVFFTEAKPDRAAPFLLGTDGLQPHE